MSDSINQVSGSESPQGPQGPNSTNPSQGKPQGDPSKQMGSNMGRLQTEKPEIWNEMLKGVAMELCNKWQKYPERLKKIRQESERR